MRRGVSDPGGRYHQTRNLKGRPTEYTAQNTAICVRRLTVAY